MKPNEEKHCILCEAEGRDGVLAKYFIEFNKDLIPVCSKHHKQIQKDKIIEVFEDEQSD